MSLQVLESPDDPGRLRLVGDLDLHTAEAAAEAILRKCSQPELSLDLSDLGFMDSSGVWVLLRAQKAVSSHGGLFILLSPNPTVKRIIDVLGLQANGVMVRDRNDAGS